MFAAVLLAMSIRLTRLPRAIWESRAGAFWIGFFFLLLALGFLLSRFFHAQSLLFRLFRRMGRLQTSGRLDDLCIVNAGILGMLGAFFLIMALLDRLVDRLEQPHRPLTLEQCLEQVPSPIEISVQVGPVGLQGLHEL